MDKKCDIDRCKNNIDAKYNIEIKYYRDIKYYIDRCRI